MFLAPDPPFQPGSGWVWLLPATTHGQGSIEFLPCHPFFPGLPEPLLTGKRALALAGQQPGSCMRPWEWQAPRRSSQCSPCGKGSWQEQSVGGPSAVSRCPFMPQSQGMASCAALCNGSSSRPAPSSDPQSRHGQWQRFGQRAAGARG